MRKITWIFGVCLGVAACSGTENGITDTIFDDMDIVEDDMDGIEDGTGSGDGGGLFTAGEGSSDGGINFTAGDDS